MTKDDDHCPALQNGQGEPCSCKYYKSNINPLCRDPTDALKLIEDPRQGANDSEMLHVGSAG